MRAAWVAEGGLFLLLGLEGWFSLAECKDSKKMGFPGKENFGPEEGRKRRQDTLSSSQPDQGSGRERKFP